MNNPIINLLTLFTILFLYTLQYQRSFISRIVAVIVYLGTGIVAEGVGVVLLKLISYEILCPNRTKDDKVNAGAAGQLNMYLNYYEKEVNDEDDNKPIGIILCTDKDALTAEYALGGLSNNIFASKYTYYIPDREQLIAEVEKIIRRWER